MEAEEQEKEEEEEGEEEGEERNDDDEDVEAHVAASNALEVLRAQDQEYLEGSRIFYIFTADNFR